MCNEGIAENSVSHYIKFEIIHQDHLVSLWYIVLKYSLRSLGRSLVWVKISNIVFALFDWSKGYMISDERSTKFMWHNQIIEWIRFIARKKSWNPSIEAYSSDIEDFEFDEETKLASESNLKSKE